MVCWGIDNNLTQHISNKDPTQIAQLKGIVAGATSLSLAVLLGMQIPVGMTILYALILGSLSYGLSLVFFIKALEGLGSSRSGAFFSFGPFVGALVSILILGETITLPFAVASILMILGVWMMLTERHGHLHRHERITHANEIESDIHHQGLHLGEQVGTNSSEHTHEAMVHSHVHWPDQHHRHDHQ
jgi:drug/metabolite transporter (DMT)-like permease